MASDPISRDPHLETIDSYKRAIERELQRASTVAAQESAKLDQAARYVLEGQGKRLRGLLVMAIARDLGGQSAVESSSVSIAVAVEMLHAASLVHDDLPALDNDDTRRGRPSCHRAFSEATAILVGDLLVGRALERVGEGTLPAEGQLSILTKMSKSWADLCVGQQLDIEKPTDAAMVERLMALKTGALFGFSAYAGAVCGGVPGQEAERFFQWGRDVGVLFQKLDDISDGEVVSVEPFNAPDEVERSRRSLGSLVAGRPIPHTEAVYERIVGAV